MSNQLEKVKELIELRARRVLAVVRKLSKSNMLKGNILHVNVLLCCLMKEVSKKWICL